MNYKNILSLIDVPWVIFFLVGATLFGLSFRGKWISRGALTAFLLMKMTICIGFSSWALLTDQDFDSGGYFFYGEPYAERFGELLKGESTEYLEITPFYGRAGISTDRLNSFSGLLLAISGRSFLASSLTLCCLGAIGQLLIFRYLVTRFPAADYRYFYLILFHPSSALWSGLLLKDTLGMFALGLMIYNLDRLLVERRLRNLLLLALGCYIALNFRSFILVMISVFFFFAFWDRVVQPSSHRSEKGNLFPYFYVFCSSIISLSVLVYYVRNYAGEMIDIQRATNAGYSQIEAGSTFDNAELSFSGGGLLALPMGVINTLLRPFIWEVTKANQAVAALENLFVLVVVCLGWRAYLFRLNRDVKRDTRGIVLGAIMMTVISAAGVGLYSSNLGSISRYRTPVIPLFMLGPCVALGLASRRRNLTGQHGLRRPGRGLPRPFRI